MDSKRPSASTASLDPIDRLGEAIFAIIMTLTFTSAMSIAGGPETSVMQILGPAISCNVAWGFVDSVMYCITTLVENGRTRFRARRIALGAPETAHAQIRQMAADRFEIALTDAQIDEAIARLKAKAHEWHWLTRDDIKAAGGIFLTAVIAGLPILAPFVLLDHLPLAIRWSNGIGVLLLFGTGYALGQQMGLRGWLFATGFAIVGSLLALATVLLGG